MPEGVRVLNFSNPAAKSPFQIVFLIKAARIFAVPDSFGADWLYIIRGNEYKPAVHGKGAFGRIRPILFRDGPRHGVLFHPVHDLLVSPAFAELECAAFILASSRRSYLVRRQKIELLYAKLLGYFYEDRDPLLKLRYIRGRKGFCLWSLRGIYRAGYMTDIRLFPDDSDRYTSNPVSFSAAATFQAFEFSLTG